MSVQIPGTPELSLSDAVKAAYTYAYPLVLMDITRQVSTNVATVDPDSSSGKAPMNQFALSRNFVDASQTDVVRPNADTLYCLAWLDLGPEPLVMTVGDIAIYYMLPFVNGWTNVLTAPPNQRSIGTANDDIAAANYALCGPGFAGELPAGLIRVDIATNIAWLLGRIECHGDTQGEDIAYGYDNVHRLQDTLKLIPLSAWISDPDGYVPPVVPVNPDVNTEITPPEQVADLTCTNCSSFFTIFCSLLSGNPADPADPLMAAVLHRLGLVPDATIAWDQTMSEADFATAQAAAVAALNAITDPSTISLPDSVTPLVGTHSSDSSSDSPENNNWSMITGPLIADFGRHYFYRALIANKGLGANLAVDAIYPSCFKDSDNNDLLNTQTYTLTFPPGQTPPAHGFWSVTAYNADGYFIDNALDVYALHNWDKLVEEPDGSIIITLCLVDDGEDYSGLNVLPLGNAGDDEGTVNLTMRIYWPDLDRINDPDNPWIPPALNKQGAAAD